MSSSSQLIPLLLLQAARWNEKLDENQRKWVQIANVAVVSRQGIFSSFTLTPLSVLKDITKNVSTWSILAILQFNKVQN